MNAKHILAAVAVFTASSAFAADNGMYVDRSGFVSTKTRAEVQAELAQARASGQLGHEAAFVEHQTVASTRTRDDVRRETIQSAHGQAAQSVYFGG